MLDKLHQLLGFSKMSYTHTGRVSLAEALVAPGETFIFTAFASSAPAALAVHPDTGARATVSITCSTPARIAAETANWVPANMGDAGVVTDPTIIDIPAPITGIRVEAAGGYAVVEVVQ